MRNKIIEYFIADDASEVSLPQELMFYGIMGSPILIFIITMILV